LVLERARRVWSDQGNVQAASELEALLARVPSTTAPDASARMLNAIVNAFNLGYSPRLLASELIDTAQALGCADEIQLLEISGKPAGWALRDPWLLPLGEAEGKSYALRSKQPRNSSKA